MKIVLKVILLLATVVVSGCGINMPERTKMAVSPKNVIGEWKYPLTTNAGEAHIIFHEDGSYELTVVNNLTKSTTTRQGKWELDEANLTLTPFYCLVFHDPTKLEQHDSTSCFFTETEQHTLALFGGDSFDPDNWVILSRVK